MTKGYYFTRSQYLKSLDNEIDVKNAYDRVADEATHTGAPKDPEILSLDELLSDPKKASRLALIQLKKFMLPNDANKALQFLEKNNRINSFIQLSNSFYKFIGEPSVYSISNFMSSWNLFDKRPSVLPTDLFRDIGKEEEEAREAIKEEKSTEFTSDEIKKLVKDHYDIKITDTDKLFDEEANDILEEEEKGFITLKEAKEKMKEAVRKLREERLGKLQEKRLGKKVMEMMKSRKARKEAEAETGAEAELSRVPSFGVSSEALTMGTSDPVRQRDAETLEEILENLKTYSGTGPLRGGLGKTGLINILNKYTDRKLDTAYGFKELITPTEKVLEALKSTESGSGLRARKAKKSAKNRKDKKVRINILKGEERAGNRSKVVAKQLKNLTFN